MILCKICKIFIFRPKWPSFVFSVTASLRTSSVGFLGCSRSRYAILCKICNIFIFCPKWPGSVLSVTESFGTYILVILVFPTKICDLMQTIDVKFSFLVQNGIRVHPPSCITPWWHSDLIPKKKDFLPIFYSYLISTAKIVVLKISVF